MSGQGSTVESYRIGDGESGPEVTVDLGGGDLSPADLMGPSGDDSPPLAGDFASISELDGESESLEAVAYSDDTPRVAEAGEKRIYSRDPSGAVVAEIHLKGDGSLVLLTSATGSTITVAADGSVTISGTQVSLAAGEPLGSFLQLLHAGFVAWVPVVNDGGAALKASLGTWLTKVPPGP